MANPISLRWTQITFLSPHFAIITSSSVLTHVTVITIPLNGLDITFPTTAIWPLSTAQTHCSTTKSSGGYRWLVISAAHHSMGLCLVYGNSAGQDIMNSSALRSSPETGWRLAKDRTDGLGLSNLKRERPQKTAVLRLVKMGYNRS